MIRSHLLERPWPLVEESIRFLRLQFILWLPYILFWAPLSIRFSLLVMAEMLYNIYLFFAMIPTKTTAAWNQIIKEGGEQADNGGVAIVTGGTSGIGKEVTRALLAAGYHVHLPARNMAKAEAVANEFRAMNNTTKDKVTIYHCDVSSIPDIKNFVAKFRNSNSSLDLLINNAGNYSPTFQVTPDGVESHLGTHVMGAYALTMELKDLLTKSDSPRVINITSSTYYLITSFNMNAFTSKEHFSRFGGYSNAKYAQTLLTLQLALDLKDSHISVNCVHPGMVDTDIARDDPLARTLFNQVLRTLLPFSLVNPKQAALTILWVALSPKTRGLTGRYFHDLVEEPISWALYREFVEGKGKAITEFCKGRLKSV